MDHANYIFYHGLFRWFLRECIRANPLYVISAALLAYGVTQLNTEIDPQIGHAGGIVLSLTLLHVYEICILIAATAVLHNRTGGGRDLHGLTMVAGLFLGGSFLALDELIAIWPVLGFILIPAALALAAFKLAWYSRLPGIYLPRIYRHVMLIVIGLHSVSPLLGSQEMKVLIGVKGAQNIAWLLGWIALVPVLYLIGRYNRGNIWPDRPATVPDPDPLITHRCGALGVAISIATGIAHLHGSDWVYDRQPDTSLLLPSLAMLGGCVILLRWPRHPFVDSWNLAFTFAPALMAQWAWYVHWPSVEDGSIARWTGIAFQTCVVSGIFYVMMAWITKRKVFYYGLAAPVAAPVWTYLSRNRNSIPHYRALTSIVAGFCLLIAGMLVSLFREKLLARLEQTGAAAKNSSPAAP